jgi:ABC-type hemin transport system ATPase subunit
MKMTNQECRPNIYEALIVKLGRAPTHKEQYKEVKRIQRESQIWKQAAERKMTQLSKSEIRHVANALRQAAAWNNCVQSNATLLNHSKEEVNAEKAQIALNANDDLVAAVKLTIGLLQELNDGGANNPELEILKAALAKAQP